MTESNAVERYVGSENVSSIELAPKAWELANKIAKTDFVPRGLRGNPEATMAAMLTGHELGIGPMQALAKIHVVDGRPGLAAELMRALILREGHELWIEESTGTRCTIVGQRKGSTREQRVTWTHDDAVKAGLLNKDNWKKYERAMLLARATTELARAVFPDVLAGIAGYEELLDGESFEIDLPLEYRDGEKTDEAEKTPPKKKAVAKKAAVTKAPAKKTEPDPEPAKAREQAPLPGEDDIVDAELVDEEEHEHDEHSDKSDGPRYTGPQIIAIRLGELGVDDRDAKLRIVAGIIGRKVESTNDLTNEELGEVLEVIRSEVFTPAPWLEPAADVEKTPPPPAEEAPPAASATTWTSAEWRAFVTDRGVKVTELIKEASRLAKEDGDRAPTTLDELATATSESVKSLLVGYVEDLALQRNGS